MHLLTMLESPKKSDGYSGVIRNETHSLRSRYPTFVDDDLGL